ncbi:MAG: hypothetical protein PHV20_14215 [Bacteroidales bacterium]|nr:hypothetical protein [Bacteroidales bacterium]
MKKLVVLSITFLSFITVNAQNGFHEHDGFYLSMGLGASSGSISITSSQNSQTTKGSYDGTGGIFDLKIGGKIKKNLILHATLTSLAITGPNIKQNGVSLKADNNFSVGQAMLGAGLTYYTSSNFFFSGSVGSGNFTTIDSNTNKTISTDHGLAFQLKLGKEWWVSKNWGLGIGALLQSCSVNNDNNGMTQKLDGTQFGVMFNATFN